MHPSRIIMPLFFSLLALPPASYGEATDDSQNSALEQIMGTEVTTVIGASKYQQELVEAPASVSIVTSDDIRKGGHRTLAEILNSVRGFYTTDNRAYSFIGLRGFSPQGDLGTRVLVLVDGHRLNDAVFGHAGAGGDFPLDVDLIDRVEVIRGPGSSLYGTSAFVAVINVITRSAKDLRGGELSASGGSLDAWTGRVTGGGKWADGADLLFSGSYRDSAGNQKLFFPEYAASNGGIAQGIDGETSWDLLTKVSWKDVSLLLLHQQRHKAISTASFGSIFNDPGEKTSDEHTLAGLNYAGQGRWADLNAHLTYNRYQYGGDYPLDSSGVRTLSRDRTVAEWIGSDLFASRSFGPHLVILGTEQRFQFNELQQNALVTPTHVQVLDDHHHSYVQGYYLQDEYHLAKDLILNAGLRYDHYDTFGGTTNPRAALIWKPRDGTVLRLSYGEAFRAPNAFELYYGDGSSQKGNPQLKPEKVRTGELNWDQFIGNYIKTTATVYVSRFEGLLVQVVDPADNQAVFTNQSRLESKGLELQAEGKWENGYSGLLSYCYQETRDPGGHGAVNSPRNLAKGSFTVPLPPGKSSATLEMFYAGSRLNANRETVDGGAIFNLTLLNRDLLKGLDLSASIYNLFDTSYAVPSGPEHFNSLGETLREIPQNGITFRIKATYRF